MSSKQVTFDGEEASRREIPDTFVYCEECGERVLRSRVGTHPHTTGDNEPGTAIRYTVETELQLQFEIDVDPLAADSDTNIQEEVRTEAIRRFSDVFHDVRPVAEIQGDEEVPISEAEPHLL